MQEEGHILLVLHTPANPDDIERTAAFFWRKPDGTWMSDQPGSGEAGVDAILDRYDDVFAQCDRLELNATTSEEYYTVLERAAPVVRSVRHMHAVLCEARKLCTEDRRLIDWRDRAYEIERRGELLYNGAKNSLDFQIAKRSEEQTKASHQMSLAAHRLNLLAAFFFPIATLTGIFGVNFSTGLENYMVPIPFLLTLVVGVFSGVVLTTLIVRKEKRTNPN